jgi:hypothetical protein
MSEYSKARCIVCGTLFRHENATEQTCGLDCDRELKRQKQEQERQSGATCAERVRPRKGTMSKYIKITLHGGSSYVQPESELLNALNGELDGVEPGEHITLDLEPLQITDEEYAKLPDFAGH